MSLVRKWPNMVLRAVLRGIVVVAVAVDVVQPPKWPFLAQIAP